jgi:hypothetical protein
MTKVDFQGIRISGFVFNILFTIIVVVFFIMNHTQNKLPNSIVNGNINQRYFYIISGFLLVAAFVFEMLLLVLKDPANQVRLSTFDLLVMIAWIYLSVTLFIQDRRYSGPRWKSVPHIYLYIAWALSLIIIGLNLTLFFGS